MKKIVFINFLILITSCGLKTEYDKEYSIEPLLQDHFETFLNNEYIKTGRYREVDDLVMQIKPLGKSSKNDGSKVLGTCSSNTFERVDNFKKIIKKTPIITIDETYYNNNMASYNYYKETNPTKASNLIAAIQVVVDHELGHCLLNREHDDSYLNRTQKTSIMSSSILNTRDYLTNYEYYQSELFGHNDGYVENFESSFLGPLALMGTVEN